MIVTTAVGEQVEVQVGDEVYVDFGDSITARPELRGRVREISASRIVLADGRNFNPSTALCVDVLGGES